MSMKFFVVVLMSLAVPFFSQTLKQGDNFRFEPKQRKLFSLWEEDKEILVAAEMLIDCYPQQTFISNSIKSKQGQDLSTPENLIAYEYELMLKADLEMLINNYHDDDDKAYGRKLYQNIKHRQSWNIKNVKDIEYRTKAIYGNLIHIKCKKIEKTPKQFSSSWNLLCKQYGERFYFVGTREGNDLFSNLCEAFPFWDSKRMYESKDKVKGLSKFTFIPTDSNSAQAKASRIDVYLKIKHFGNEADANLKKEVNELLAKLRKLYLENNKKELLNLWLPQIREDIESDFLDDNAAYKRSQTYFQKSEGITVDFYIGTPNVCFVFGRKVVDGKAEDNIKIFKFIRKNGTLYLSDSMEPLYLEEKEELYMTEKIIDHPQMREFYNKILREN